MRGFVVAAAVSVVALSFAPQARADEHRGKISWVDNVKEGMAQARKTGRPMMLFFTADW